MLKRGNSIIILTYWPLESALVKAYVFPYLEIIRELVGPSIPITLVTLENSKTLIRVSSLPIITNCMSYRIRYTKFGFLAFASWIYEGIRLFFHCRKRSVSVVHAWCTPAGAIGYVLSRFLQVPLIVDSYEPHADAMVENGTWSKKGLAFKTLFYFERKISLHATYLVSVSDHMRTYRRHRYSLADTPLLIKPACVDLNKFKVCLDRVAARKRMGLPSGTTMVYAGKFGGIYFDAEIFRFAAYLKKFHFPDLTFLVLTDTPRDTLLKWSREYNFPSTNLISMFLPHEQVGKYIATADFALSPIKPVPSKLCCSPLKNGEYWACGLPIIISPNISVDSDIIKKNKLGVICEFSSPHTYSAAANQLRALLFEGSRDLLQIRIRSHACKYRNFKIAYRVYSKIYVKPASRSKPL